MNGGTALTLHFSPLLPEAMVYGLAGLALVLFAAAAIFSRPGLVWRTLALAAFFLALLNPSLLEEERKPVADVAAIVVDRSPSQDEGNRTARTDAALAALRKQLEGRKDLDLRIVETPAQSGSGPVRETRLFGALEQALADVPEQRRAGAVFLTDGQVRDVPPSSVFGPVHALLSGERNEKDRQLVITQAPAYGIVGQSVTVKYRIEDTDNIHAETATVIVRSGGGEPQILRVPTGQEQSFDFTVDHAGQNVFEMEASPVEGELTEANNRAAFLVNGVRDRLKVLLVSGQPYAGERTWRNILTSDPGVDLVHFTILREPDKLDATPQKELSLIAFPFRELFEVKLYDFDLIIFDRYRLNRILPTFYFSNIVKYVQDGGALLVVNGPDSGGQDSIYETPLAGVLPGAPVGEALVHAFRPALTETGRLHPVTQGLSWNGGEEWGRWLRQVSLNRLSGNVLMSGIDGSPILILDRVGKGRVAQFASDQIWLWSRGYDGGGPHAELLRRLGHWLMKEPELDENALDVRTDGDRIVVRKRSLDKSPATVTMQKPDGAKVELKLEPKDNGWSEADVEAEALGVYAFESGDMKQFAIVGDLNPPELRDIKTTDVNFRPLAEASGGSVSWLVDDAAPEVRLMRERHSYAGHGWIGLRRNDHYTVTGVKDSPLLPPWAAVLILLGLATFAWWREGRSA